MPFAQDPEHAVDSARGRCLARTIAIEADDGLRRELPELIHLPLGERGAEGCNHVLETRLMQPNYVHVALDHDQFALVEGGSASAREVEYGRALVKELGFGRVQIFRLGRGIQRTGAKSDDAAPHIDDGDGEPVAEAIISAGTGGRVHEEGPRGELGLAATA